MYSITRYCMQIHMYIIKYFIPWASKKSFENSFCSGWRNVVIINNSFFIEHQYIVNNRENTGLQRYSKETNRLPSRFIAIFSCNYCRYSYFEDRSLLSNWFVDPAYSHRYRFLMTSHLFVEEIVTAVSDIANNDYRLIQLNLPVI